MKCLVTGGAGFIGSNLVDQLLEDGHQVVVVDNESSNNHDESYWNENTENFYFNLSKKRNCSRLKEICETVDWVFHMAADVSIPYCIKKPSSAYLNNVSSLLNVLDAARSTGVKKVVFSSTAAIYGVGEIYHRRACKETDTPDPLNPYSVSKLAGEHLMKMYHSLYGIKTVSLRYFNVYGPRQPSTGQYAPVIGIFKNQKDTKRTLTIVGDGYQTRDFIHVSDVVAANIMVAEREPPSGYPYGNVYNVGTGVENSIQGIADMISPDQIHVAPRIGEARQSVADVDKIHEAYNWSAKVKLEDWIKENV